MKRILSMLVFLVMSLSGQTEHKQSGTSRPITVCAVFENRLRYNGSLIAVRGLVDGTSEGAWLGDPACSDPIEVGNCKWPRAISLATPGQADSPVNFRYDIAAEQVMRKSFEHMGLPRDKVGIWMTYIGVFETKTDLTTAIRYDPTGAIHPSGFGHLNSAPAQLVVKTMKDIKIEKIKR